ncbi:MAG: 1-deoxy-D-xylulose-5-phosphate reductoisomerase [Steroidobacteraceae bacterium]
MRRVTILGSTGSIGENTLDVLSRHRDRFEVHALAAHRNHQRLLQQCLTWRPAVAVLGDPAAAAKLEQGVRAAKLPTEVCTGAAALDAIAADPSVSDVMAAIVGAAGLESTLAAARSGKRLLLANKEALVMSGSLLLEAVRASGATLIPIDSEHNAIFQCLTPSATPGRRPAGVRRILLTASGGPFRSVEAAALVSVTPQMACAHPNWSMGRKISVDSATLMNKGLELIEACLLFGLGSEEVEVLVHPQSIVHSLVEYQDGSVLAELAAPDMRIPIAHALAWPARMNAGADFLDLVKIGKLEFEAPDFARFPALGLALAAARAGGTAPAALNASNEIAVQAFLDGRVNFPGIPGVIESVMTTIEIGPVSGLDHVREIDARARQLARAAIGTDRLRTEARSA